MNTGKVTRAKHSPRIFEIAAGDALRNAKRNFFEKMKFPEAGSYEEANKHVLAGRDCFIDMEKSAALRP